MKVEARSLVSQPTPYVHGQVSIGAPPAGAFSIGTNGVGVVEVAGRDVRHLEPGQRLVISNA
jgi:NADPH:quinone reductase-like Zn-dependent oxidoreductase